MTIVNYKNIIDNIQSTLQDANTITADYYLSTNMAKKVVNVSKRNPNLISGQTSQFPSICIRIDNDTKTLEEMARTNISAKMRSDVVFSVIGIIYHNVLNDGNLADDPADDEIHYFAENVEEVLRRNHKLNGSVLYSVPTLVSFYEDLDEESFFRTFVMDYKTTVFY